MKKNMEHNDNYIFNSQLALPYLESEEKVIEKIFKVLQNRFNLKIHSRQRLIDLGAGDGSVIIYSAVKYDIESTGVEIKPSLVRDLRERIRTIRKSQEQLEARLKKIRIIQGDLFQQSLEGFDYVYIFSLPTMQRFLNHVFQTAEKGTIFISYKYPLEDFSYLELKHHFSVKVEKREIFSYFYEKTEGKF